MVYPRDLQQQVGGNDDAVCIHVNLHLPVWWKVVVLEFSSHNVFCRDQGGFYRWGVESPGIGETTVCHHVGLVKT